MIVTVITGASILQKITGRTAIQIHIEFDVGHLLPPAVFEHEKNGNKLSIGKFLLRNQSVLCLLEGELGWS